MKQLLLLCLLLPCYLFAQPLLVTGTVTDTEGIPLIGAYVTDIVTQGGTVTDPDGNFTLKVHPGTELTFSYTGYTNEHYFVKTAEAASVKISLAPGLNLPAVIVTAYGSCIRRCWNRCPIVCYTGCRRFGIPRDPEVTLTPLQAATVYPNPFVSHLQLDYAPATTTELSAVLLDVTGREVRRWPARRLAPGASTLTYRMGNARLLPGLYLLRLTDQDGRTEVRKVRKAYGGS